MARNPAAEGARARFAALLDRHLKAGTRPATAAGEPWTYAAFAAEVQSSREANDFASPRSVSNWCKGRVLPAEIGPIERALFGTGDRHAAAREILRKAFLAARVAQEEPDPAGPRWVERGDELVIDRAAQPSDEFAAADPRQGQFQVLICEAASALAEGARRLANSRTWGDLSAAALHALMSCEPAEVSERLVDIYARMLTLGRYLETDERVRADPRQADDPLDPDIHGLLTDLVRPALPGHS